MSSSLEFFVSCAYTYPIRTLLGLTAILLMPVIQGFGSKLGEYCFEKLKPKLEKNKGLKKIASKNLLKYLINLLSLIFLASYMNYLYTLPNPVLIAKSLTKDEIVALAVRYQAKHKKLPFESKKVQERFNFLSKLEKLTQAIASELFIGEARLGSWRAVVNNRIR